MKRKFLAWLLTLAMVFNMALPYAAFANELPIDTDASYSADQNGATNNDDDATDVGGEPTVGEPAGDGEQGEPQGEEPAVDEPAAGADENTEFAGEEVSEEPADEPQVGIFAATQGVAAVADTELTPRFEFNVTAGTNCTILETKLIKQTKQSDKFAVYLLPDDGYELSSYSQDGGENKEIILDNGKFKKWTYANGTSVDCMYWEMSTKKDVSYVLNCQKIYRFKISNNVEWADDNTSVTLPHLLKTRIMPNNKVYDAAVDEQVLTVDNYNAIADSYTLKYVKIDNLIVTYDDFAKATDDYQTLDLSLVGTANTKAIKIKLDNGNPVISFEAKQSLTEDYTIEFNFEKATGNAAHKLTATARANGAVQETKFMQDTDDGSLYYVYAKPEAGYKLTGYTVGDRTVALADTDKTCTEVAADGKTQELVYFQYKASADTEMTLNFAEGVEKSNYFTFVAPDDASLTLTNTEKSQMVAASITDTNATLGKTIYKFAKQGDRSCVFRLTGANYITYSGSAFVNAGESKIVTKEMMQPAGKTATTLDRDVTTHDGVNVSNLYMNVNAAGHLKLEQGKTFQISTLRDWIMTNYTWKYGGDYKFIQPDYHYTVLDMNGNASDDVIAVDESGLITAKANGDAIVLVSYDAINMDYPTSEVDYDANGFWGALWPENTGVFVVSVGAGETGIETGATIKQPQPLEDNLGITSEEITRAIDSEYDVIYFIGEKGEYIFTPKTAGVTVSVANSQITDCNKAGTMSFNGFITLAAAADGSYTVPLVQGKNIIKVAKGDKAEYQVITAKAVEVTVNGMPLDKAGVVPGDEVKIQLSQLYNPYNRNSYANSDAGVLYRSISGYTDKHTGNACGPWGNYKVASLEAKHTIEYFANATFEVSDEWKNPVLRTTGEKLTVPADYTGEYFTLAEGSFNIVGFGDGLEKFRTGQNANGGTTGDDGEVVMSNALYRWLGELPDIKIPVVNVDKIEVTTQPSKTTYKLNEEFSTDGMVVKVTYTNGAIREITDYTCSKLDSATVGDKTVTISYTMGGVTKTADVTVNVTDLAVTGIEVTTPPTKTTYVIGESFNPAGMAVTAHYSNGDSKVLESGEYICDTTTPFDNSKGKVNVEVKAAGLTTTVEVTVNMVVKLELDTSISQTSNEYTVGDTVGKYYVKKTSSTGATSTILSNMAIAFASSPRNRALTAYDDKYMITTPKTVSMAFQKPNLGIAGLEPLVIPITVNDETNNSANAITVNMTCVVDGRYTDSKDGKAVYNLPISVYDLDNDGNITMQDALVALHHFQYKDGACGYDENSTNGKVMRFWGVWSPNSAKYELNGTSVTKAKSQNIVADDNIVAYISDNTNSVTASFAETTATVNAGERTQFSVNAKSGETSVIPNGATVTVYDKDGIKVENLATTVYKDGGFAIRFPSAGTYTIVVGGECTYTSDGKTVTAIVWPARCTVTVGGNTSGGSTTTPEEKTVKVYVSYSEDGEFVTAERSLLYKLPLSVYDYDGDGKYTMADAFAVLHKEYYPGGADGFINAGEGWVTMFWGNTTMNLSYTQNYKWVFGVNQVIKDGDKLDIFFYQDETSYSDLLTWFAKDSYSGKTGSEITFTVNGMSVFASGENNKQAAAVPVGATVTITDENGNEYSTVTDEKGQFKLSFADPGLYTIEVGGTCSYSVGGQYGTASYSDAPVVSCRCTVSISGTSTGGGIGGATVDETKTEQKTDDKTTEANTGTGLPFTDVKAGAWYYDAIKAMYDKGLMNGESATLFAPNNKLSRAMLVTILYRMQNEPEVAANALFDDVAVGQWYTKAVAWASANNIVSGVGEGKFAPNDSVTRQEMAAMLCRYASATGLNTTATVNLGSFTDSNSVAAWAESAMQWAVGSGLIKGDENGALNPTGTATRAEVAMVIVRLLEISVK